MKVAAVYTSTTPQLIEMLNSSLKGQLAGMDAQIQSYQDPSILQEARDHGHVTPGCARRLMDLYEQAVRDGATILLNVCSSVGDVAKLAQPLYEMAGVRFVRIDEDMALQAVKGADRIGVVATLPTTMQPTVRLVRDCAARLGKEVVTVEALVDGAFGLDEEQFKQRLIEAGLSVKGQVDALLFAQGSMAYAEEAVSKAVGLPVYSSIRFGAAAVRAAAEQA